MTAVHSDRPAGRTVRGSPGTSHELGFTAGLLTLAVLVLLGLTISPALPGSAVAVHHPPEGVPPSVSPSLAWTVGALAHSVPQPVPYPELGEGLAGARSVGPAQLVSASDPLGTAPILVALNFTNSTQLGPLLRGLSDPRSPEYRQFLSHPEFDREFGGNPSVYRSLVGYFASFGVTQLTTHPDRLTISFQVTPPQVRSIFHTQLMEYRSSSDRPFFAPASAPMLPAPVIPFVSEVVGLSNYSAYLLQPTAAHALIPAGTTAASVAGGPATPTARPVIPATAPSPGSGTNPFAPTTVAGLTFPEPVHFGVAGSNCAVVTCGQMILGSELQVAYNETGIFQKFGYPVNATVVAMLWTDPVCNANTTSCNSNGLYNSFCGSLPTGSYAWDFYMPDVNTYWNYTLPAGEPLPRAVPMAITGAGTYAYPAGSHGYSAACDDQEAEGENTLDVAMAGAMAPGANVIDVFGQGATTTTLTTEFSDILSPSASEFATTGGFDTARNLAALGNTSAIANSWTGGNLGKTPAWVNDLKEAQALGITILASSGDSGNNVLGGPAENSYNSFGAVAVGGTTIVVNPATLHRTADHLFSKAAPFDGTGGGEIVWYEPKGKVAGFGATYGSVGGVTSSSTNYAPKWENASADAHSVIGHIALLGAGRGEPDISAIANDTLVDVEIGHFSANVTCTVTASCRAVGPLPGNPAVEHGWTYFVGTSISDQVASGLLGTVDYALHTLNEPKVGDLNPTIYPQGQLQYTSKLTLHPFKDVTVYHNAEPAAIYGAFAGWDADTGWGVLDAGNFSQNMIDYALTFTEAGLAPGTSWSVTLTPSVGDVGCTVSGTTCSNPTTLSSTGATIVFSVPYGSYTFRVAPVGGSPATPSSGTVAVRGASASVGVSFALGEYGVTFTESGLPGGTAWSVTLGGVPAGSTTSAISFVEPNGSYPYSVGAVPGFRATPTGGTVSVHGAPVSIGIAFSAVTYSVGFSESGLPPGLSFEVTLGGSPRSVTTDGGTDSLAFSEPNGSYAYAIGPVAGWSQSTLASHGTVVVNGAAITEPTLAYTSVTYSVTFTETGLPSGTGWSVTVNGDAQSSHTTSLAFSETNGTYPYTVGAVAGYRATPASGSAIVSGSPITIGISFSPVAYPITFSEVGLPVGTTWSVTLAGTPESSTVSSIVFSAANGTYAFAVGSVAGYSASPSAGSVAVAGSPVNVPITFTVVRYSVAFEETGLPSGTGWSVTLAGVPGSATGSSIVFSEPNGTYAYSVGPVAGYSAAPSGGSVTVSGAPQSVGIAFTRTTHTTTYAVTFAESGLPSGTSWTVTLNGSTVTSVGSTVGFTEANGSYGFSLGGVAGFTAIPASGTATVAGAPVTIPIAFSPVLYSVTFTESGLATGSSWSVTLNGVLRSATTASIGFSEANGSYAFSIGTVAGYTATPSSGTVTVAGAPVSQPVAFAAGAYTVTFTEKGLSSGKTWSVTLAGVVHSSATTSISFSEPNGHYYYTVAIVGMQVPLPASGTATVNGANVGVSITFSSVITLGGVGPSGATFGPVFAPAQAQSPPRAVDAPAGARDSRPAFF